jgi:serine phosphatase RsbU (regulator of sigma subunit)
MQLDAPALGRGFFWPVFIGAVLTSILVARIRKVRLLPLLAVLIAGTVWLANRASRNSTPLPIPRAIKEQVIFDAVGIWLGVALGSRLLLSFLTTEGLANVRMQTELSLAHGIQSTLVPTVSIETPSFEVYGKSIPSAEMGGDLIDVIQNDGSLLAYIADVSGHGLSAGQLMGMLKTAMRVSLQFRLRPAALLESADRVLPAVKEADMYATLALLYFEGSGEAAYALAGHVPILHYRDSTGEALRLSMEQFPLGLVPGGHYASARVTYSPRDVFLMLTDGISEATNERDEQFGLERIEQLLARHPAEPLPQIWELIMDEVKHHGAQQDDQSLLLLRVRE